MASTRAALVDRASKRTFRSRNDLVSIESRDGYSVVQNGEGLLVGDQLLWSQETVPDRSAGIGLQIGRAYFQHCSDLTHPPELSDAADPESMLW